MYCVSNYGPAGVTVPEQTVEFSTLAEAREEVRRRLGDLEDWRKWAGLEDDNDIEAYHASREEMCGGVSISRETSAQ